MSTFYLSAVEERFGRCYPAVMRDALQKKNVRLTQILAIYFINHVRRGMTGLIASIRASVFVLSNG